MAFSSGLLFAVHRRLLVVPLALLACAALWRTGRRRPAWLAAAAGTVAGLALAYGWVRLSLPPAVAADATIHTGAVLGSYGAEGPQPSALFASLAVLCGQLLYLTTATGGLFLLGLWRALVGLYRVARLGSTEPREGLAALIALWLLVAMPVHALFLRTRLQLDYLLHGRYNEALCAPVLLLGLAWLWERRRGLRTSLAVTGLVVLLTASCYLLVQLRAGGRLLYLLDNPVNTLALYPFLTAPWGGSNLLILQLVTASVLLGLLLTVRPVGRSSAVGLALLALLFGGVTYWDLRHYLAPGSVERFHERTMASFLRTVACQDRRTTVAVDRDLLERWDWGWHAYNYAFFADCAFRTFRFDGGKPAAPVVITRRPDVAERWPGAQLAGYEPGPTVLFWVLDGPASADLRNRWPMLPPDHIVSQVRDPTGKVFWPLPLNTKNVYPDNGWTSGNSAISFLGYQPTPGDRYLELRTHGLRLRSGFVPVTAIADGEVLAFSHQAGVSYYFALPPERRRIDEVRIISSTFSPMEAGEGDRRSLGIDVAAIAFVAEKGG